MGVSRSSPDAGARSSGTSAGQSLSSRMIETVSHPDALKVGFHRRRWFLRMWLRLAVILCLTVVGLRSPGVARGADIAALEHRVKAAYVFQFAIFTDWPTNSFPSAESPLVIGVVGNEDVADEVDIIAGEQRVRGKPLRILRLKPEQDLSICHVLFIGRGQNFESILRKVQRTSVLTVGEQENFAKNGGVFNLVPVGDTIKFNANRAAIENANLKVKAQVLRIAKEVFDTIPARMRGRP